MISQLTVFLGNEEGRLAKLCRAMADAGANMSALTIADTTEYGIVRIVCADPAAACAALTERGYRAMLTEVAAFELPNRPGALAGLLGILDDLDIDVAYGYCFSSAADRAVMVLKVSEAAETPRALVALRAGGYRMLAQDEL